MRFEEDVIADRFILLVGKKLNQLEILFLINQQKLILFLSIQLMSMVIHFHQGLVLTCILSDYKIAKLLLRIFDLNNSKKAADPLRSPPLVRVNLFKWLYWFSSILKKSLGAPSSGFSNHVSSLG